MCGVSFIFGKMVFGGKYYWFLAGHSLPNGLCYEKITAVVDPYKQHKNKSILVINSSIEKLSMPAQTYQIKIIVCLLK